MSSRLDRTLVRVKVALKVKQCEGLPLGQRPPGAVLVGEDVDDLLL